MHVYFHGDKKNADMMDNIKKNYLNLKQQQNFYAFIKITSL